VLGIVDDHELGVDPVAKASLERKLLDAPKTLGPITAGEEDRQVGLEIDLPEAGLLLEALRFTDTMSMHLPFYDMIVETIQFVGDQITDLWSADEWMTFNDARAKRKRA
jgi:hypothetical protein